MQASALDLRTKILTAYQHDEGSIRQLVQRCKVSPRFVGQLVVCFRRTGRCAPKPHGGGNPPCIARSHYAILSGLGHAEATLKELCRLFEDSEHVAASKSSMQRTLVPLHATERASEEVQKQRRLHQAKVSTLKANDRVLVDEPGVHIAMTRPYARAPTGQRVDAAVPVNIGKHLTILAALALAGLVEAMTIIGRSDGWVFSTLLGEVCVPIFRPGQTVIMDTRSSHKVEGIQEAIEAVGASLEYVPPYSPDGSPIEECWSQVQTILRAKAAWTSAHLDQAMAEAFDLITPQDARGWFVHGGYV